MYGIRVLYVHQCIDAQTSCIRVLYRLLKLNQVTIIGVWVYVGIQRMYIFVCAVYKKTSTALTAMCVYTLPIYVAVRVV